MPSTHANHFLEISDKGLDEFAKKHETRERGLQISRLVIRLSANAVRAVHRGEYLKAETLIAEARMSLEGTKSILSNHPDIYYAGYLSDARKEFSEANLTLALLSGKQMPNPEDIDVDITAFLKGLGDTAGEIRRYILDSLRKDNWDRCEELMEVMDELYGLLVTMDFPEGVTGGLRHTTDMVRGTLERTRGDFTMALRQRELEQKLSSWEKSLDDRTADG